MGGRRMIHVERSEMNITGSPKEMLAEGIIAAVGAIRLAEEIGGKEYKEDYIKNILKYADNDTMEITKWNTTVKKKTENESEETKLEKRRKFINGNNEDRR